MLGVQEVVIKGGQALMPPSFSYCVTIVNPSILSQVVLKGGCQDIQTLRSQLRFTLSNMSFGKSVFLSVFLSMHQYAFLVRKSDGHDMFPTQSDLKVHILLYLNDIDLCLNTRLVHDLYLKRMESHQLMIDYEKISCKISL